MRSRVVVELSYFNRCIVGRLYTPLTILNRKLRRKSNLLLDRLGMLFVESKVW